MAVSASVPMPSSTRNSRAPAPERDAPPHQDRRGLVKHHGLAHLQAYLDAFARFLTSGDGAAIAKMWEYPALIISNDQLMPIADARQIEGFFGGARAQYNARGIADTRAEIQHAAWLTDRIVSATVRWPYLDADNQEVGEETGTYTLRRDNDGELRMCTVVMHGEKRKD